MRRDQIVNSDAGPSQRGDPPWFLIHVSKIRSISSPLCDRAKYHPEAKTGLRLTFFRFPLSWLTSISHLVGTLVQSYWQNMSVIPLTLSPALFAKSHHAQVGIP
jgi:hypothetical protein